MIDNTALFHELLAAGRLPLRRGAIFDRPAAPKGPAFDFGRVEGMLLGLAVGDALGVPTESMLPAARRARHGEIRGYLPHPAVGERRGFPSDDTQLAFWTLEQLVEDGGLVPERLADRFTRERIFGIGDSVRQFLQNAAAGRPWTECGPASAGNGALMRIAPVLVPHLRGGGTALWADAALAALVTHNDAASLAACVAFVDMLWELLDLAAPPEPAWWVDRFVAAAADLEAGRGYRPRGGRFTDYAGPAWRYVAERVRWAWDAKLAVREACDAWYSGAYLLETLPSVLYILMRHGHDPQAAIVRAVNDTWDNDTVAAIVGAAVGALHGRAALPAPWLRDLSGRTAAADDGRIFDLLASARDTFWDPPNK